MSEPTPVQPLPAADKPFPRLTAGGWLYEPRRWPYQLGIVLVAGGVALFGARYVGAAVGLGSHAEDGGAGVAGIICFLAFAGTFFLGYILWIARVKMLVAAEFGGLVRRILWLLGSRVIASWFGRRSSEGTDETFREQLRASIPNPSELQERAASLLARGQRAARVFLWAGALAGMIVVITCLIGSSALGPSLSAAAVCWAYGAGLAWLGRHGWLPMVLPDEEI